MAESSSANAQRNLRRSQTESTLDQSGGKKTHQPSYANHRFTGLPQRPASLPGQTSQATSANVAAAKLPTYDYAEYKPKANVSYITTDEEANKKVQELSGPLGFDMEWPYDRIRDKSGRTALIQICDEKQILLFHVSRMENFPENVKAVIENPDVPKLGVNIRSDGMKLFGDFGILASNLIELGALAGQADERFAASYNRPIVALAKVVEFYLQRTLKKGPERASQWQDDLNPLQMTYAANDAHCSLMVYKKLIAVASETNRALSPDVYTRDLAKELASLSKAECALSESELVRPITKQLMAYTLWRAGCGLLGISVRMRSREIPLEERTVITYIVNAIRADPKLPVDLTKLRALIQTTMPSWLDHQAILAQWVAAGRGVEGA